jgi:ferrous iron transport protein B
MSAALNQAVHAPSDTKSFVQHTRPLTIALAGNPNAGKTSLFNALTGLRQKVANYPGVTVERKEGLWTLASDTPPARLIDLPGLYSLDAASLDEQIARSVIMGRSINGETAKDLIAPDVILAVVDATNLARNLYLVTQLLESGRPLVVALTMIDLAERQGIQIDATRLSKLLNAPVVRVNAAATRKSARRGLDELAQAVLEAAKSSSGPGAGWRLSEETEREISALIAKHLEANSREQISAEDASRAARYEIIHALFAGDENSILDTDVRAARERLARANPNWWQELVTARYDWIESIVAQTVTRANAKDKTLQRAKAEQAEPVHDDAHATNATQRIDSFVTHRIFGPVILLLVMLVVFQTIFSWANLPMDLIDKGFGALGDFTRAHLPAGLFTDLLVDGVIAGVGGVIVFLPQILLLFFFIAILEDSGYMARAAFLMDRLMRGVGLHGKAFVPLLSSFACAIPGIMATRTIENPKDRLATILIAPFMSCSARLPVYTLMIAAFFPDRKVFGVISLGAIIIMTMYLLGIAVAIIVAWILKRTILKSPPPPFVLELPPYRVPNALNILHTMLTRASLFLRRAGTVILAISILLWALVTFPRTGLNEVPSLKSQVPSQSEKSGVKSQESGEENPQSKIGNQNSADLGLSANPQSDDEGAQIRNSFAGRMGRLIEPVIRPLGFDWKIGIALISSFAARETLVSTLSIVYNVGAAKVSKGGDTPQSLIEAVRAVKREDGSPAWTPLVAVSLMVFFVLACQCMSTVAVVRRETNSWRYPIFMVTYMLALAYIASFITYQGGRLLGFG